MNKMVITRDVVFNFNGDLKALEHNLLHPILNELLQLLQKCAIPTESGEKQEYSGN